MKSTLSRRSLTFAFVAIGALVVAIGGLLYSVPAVQGLGNKVKLPLFHGGSTWVNLWMFTLMGAAAVGYLIWRDDRFYEWEFGFRAVAAPQWVVNSALGFIAAMNTWDFTASHQSKLVIIRQDPRLMAQVFLLFGVVIVVVMDWIVLEKRMHKAILDVVFVVVMWILMADIFLDPVKRALHPDSPVLNSGWDIKGPFFAMVACIFAVLLLAAWIVKSFSRDHADKELADTADSVS